jgi:serine/threonine protein kinase
VMEYLDGTDLAGWIRGTGVLVLDQAVDFVLQASEAIAEAHSLGIVHRDLKPANLFVIRRPDGALSVKVLDFGISKMAGVSAASSDMTRTSAVMGSPLYMPPEQLHSAKDADARSDVWSIGVILYELLTAELPFVADSLPGLVAQILSTSPKAVKEKRSDVPEGLDDVIRKCLEKDRGKRFQTIGELAAALAPFSPKRSKISLERIYGIMRSSGMSGTALAPPSSSDRAVAAGTGAGTVASWEGGTRARGRGRWFIAASVGALAVIGVTVATLRSRWPSHSVSATTENMELSKPRSADAPPPREEVTTQMAVTPSAETTPIPSPPAASAEAIAVAPAPVAVGTTTAAPAREPTAVRPAQPRTSRTLQPAPTKAPAARQEPVSPAPSEPHPAAPQPAAPAKPSCNPNFYYDANGHKHFKPECF